MEPDKAWQILKDAGFLQPHTVPSRETLRMFSEFERRVDAKLETKIGKTTFWTVFSLVASMAGAMFFLVWDQAKDNGNSINQVRERLGVVVGKLETIDFVNLDE